jgi:hypothetical protein
MIKVTIKVDNSQLNARLSKQQTQLTNLAKDSIDKFKSLTPIDTGNARSKTYLASNNSKIVANYSYAQALDNGHSKQAPDGMIKPFTTWFKQQLKKIGK